MAEGAAVDFGSPIVFFDSHPEMQESYLYSYWSSLKSSLNTAWTGDVPKFHETGVLRILFWTIDGTQGLKDYELREYEKVREDWLKLCDLEDVSRALVMGYSGQNPYTMGKNNPWVERFQRERKNLERQEAERQRMEERNKAKRKADTKGELIDFDDLIARTEEAEWVKAIEEQSQSNISEKDRLLDV